MCQNWQFLNFFRISVRYNRDELLKIASVIKKPPASKAHDAAAYNSGEALERLDALLGDGEWDLIYFNFGLGDLFYKDPATREIRAMSKYSGGVRVTPADEYEKNLENLVQRLKATGSKVVWGTTTPLVSVNSFPSYRDNLYDANSELEYNEIAAKVMKRHGIPIIDVHSHIMAQFGPEDKHPGYEAYEKDFAKKKIPIHPPVVEGILKELK